MNIETCKKCKYYHRPDILPTEPVCNFPWFDYTEEDLQNKECKSEDN